MNTHSGREDEVRQFHKPVRRPSDVLEEFDGSGDPADESSTAHDTAAVLVHLVGDKAVPAVRTRLVEYIAAEGIEDLLELWSRAAAARVAVAVAADRTETPRGSRRRGGPKRSRRGVRGRLR